MASIAPNMRSVPVVMRSSANTPIMAGMTVPVAFDNTKIQNTYRVPIEINEILITCSGWTDQGGVEINNTQPGAITELELRVRNYDMTNGFIPFEVMAPFLAAEDNANLRIDILTSNDTYIFAQRRVVLPSPIRLLPGVGFSGRIRNNGVGLTNVPTVSTTVSIAFLGRTVPEGIMRPTVQAIPIWTAASLRHTNAATRTVENDLKNPLAVPLKVEQIITSSNDYGPTRADLNDSTWQDPKFRLRFPNGDLLNQNQIQFQSAFIRRHALAAKFEMPSFSRLSAEVEFNGLLPNEGSWLTNIAVFGTRQEVL